MKPTVASPSTPTRSQAQAWAEGRLEQRCAHCGLREAAGNYCSACQTPSTRADWCESAVTTTTHTAKRRPR